MNVSSNMYNQDKIMVQLVKVFSIILIFSHTLTLSCNLVFVTHKLVPKIEENWIKCRIHSKRERERSWERKKQMNNYATLIRCSENSRFWILVCNGEKRERERERERERNPKKSERISNILMMVQFNLRSIAICVLCVVYSKNLESDLFHEN